jgi:hypothetical protein
MLLSIFGSFAIAEMAWAQADTSQLFTIILISSTSVARPTGVLRTGNPDAIASIITRGPDSVREVTNSK